MSISIDYEAFIKQLEPMLKEMIKDQAEVLMREEMKNFFEVEHPELKNSKNGSYERILDTRYGRIDDLSVPRDRNGAFRTQLFDPYQRREKWLGETIIEMYSKGTSTREIGRFIERILGNSYSAATISNITEVVIEEMEKWHQRPLEKRYSVLYLDGTYVKLRRGDVESEVVYVVVGITETGIKEIISFRVGGKESSNGWREVLLDLYNRGIEEVLLGVFDGLPGLEEAMKEIYPKADVQRCVVHKIRNTLHSVRSTDKKELTKDLKDVYKSDTKEEAHEHFHSFKQKWGKKYPKVIKSWEEDLGVLLTFMGYPRLIRRMIYTTNTIERTIKEVKKRTHKMNSLPSERALEKIVYLVARDFNEKWSQRGITEFVSVSGELDEMFEEKYGPSANK